MQPSMEEAWSGGAGVATTLQQEEPTRLKRDVANLEQKNEDLEARPRPEIGNPGTFLHNSGAN